MKNKVRISSVLFLVTLLHKNCIAIEPVKEDVVMPEGKNVSPKTNVVPNDVKSKVETDLKKSGNTSVKNPVQVQRTEGISLGEEIEKGSFDYGDRDTFSELKNEGGVSLKEESDVKISKVEKTKEFMSLDAPPLIMNSLGDAAEYILRVVFNNLGRRTNMQKQAMHESKKAAKARAEQQVRDNKIKELQIEIENLKKSIKQDDSVKAGNYWGSYVFTDSATQHSEASTRIIANKAALGTKLSELTALQKESGVEVSLTPEQDRQQVIDGIRKIMADGAADKVFIYLKDWFPKYITTENVLSLEDKIQELNSLKVNLNPVLDQDIISEIDKIASLLNGLEDKSATGLVATTARVLPVYHNELTTAVVPTGYDIWLSTQAQKDPVQQKAVTS